MACVFILSYSLLTSIDKASTSSNLSLKHHLTAISSLANVSYIYLLFFVYCHSRRQSELSSVKSKYIQSGFKKSHCGFIFHNEIWIQTQILTSPWAPVAKLQASSISICMSRLFEAEINHQIFLWIFFFFCLFTKKKNPHKFAAQFIEKSQSLMKFTTKCNVNNMIAIPSYMLIYQFHMNSSQTAPSHHVWRIDDICSLYSILYTPQGFTAQIHTAYANCQTEQIGWT